MKNHYDVRATYADELGKALARTYDQNVAKQIANASRASTNLSGGNGGLVLTLANGNTASSDVTGDEIAAAISSPVTFAEAVLPLASVNTRPPLPPLRLVEALEAFAICLATF